MLLLTPTSPDSNAASHTTEDSVVSLSLDHVVLTAEFTDVPDARGVVVFTHGGGGARFSPRNRYVAERLRSDARVATLMLDLLATEEGTSDPSSKRVGFNTQLLARRLAAATDWVLDAMVRERLPIGYFGASAGAGAALLASTVRPEVRAVVCRGGRPDLAGAALQRVTAPTLLIAGREDSAVFEVNLSARRYLGTSEMVVVPGASSLFEEPGALDEIATRASAWFCRYLA